MLLDMAKSLNKMPEIDPDFKFESYELLKDSVVNNRA